MTNIAVFFGGRSAEHDVSIITAHIPIIQALQAAGGYAVYPIYIARNGQWYCEDDFLNLEFFKRPDFELSLTRYKSVHVSFDGGLTLVWAGLRDRRVSIDVAFPAMHGTYGEDGSLMGLLRLAGIPFVGCDLFASAVAMDKVLTKQIVAAEGIAVTPYVWFTRHDWQRDQAHIVSRVESLTFPVFVKPVHLGSSIGITKVKDPAQLAQAIEVALHYDDKVLVEQGVENLIEVTLPIMGHHEPITAQVERPLNQTEFFDFNDKYLAGGKGEGVNNQYSQIPADIRPELTEQITSMGRAVWRALGCSGIARVDFLIDARDNTVYVNEVNTLPGSLYHHNWRASGVSGVELVTRLIGYAQERQAETERTTHLFNSTILQKVGGAKIQS